ncbi:hypothetical protein EVAR_55012_1 [Eumeta japonica]|uniref:Uncharacterized protein n=1 Tax=Eumeta variegata TaxID=151549 RepID=A0A4C1YB00_EUMVA|nr:hypothetical protein EVAR_55012_1 [Eumeta japonica]
MQYIGKGPTVSQYDLYGVRRDRSGLYVVEGVKEKYGKVTTIYFRLVTHGQKSTNISGARREMRETSFDLASRRSREVLRSRADV